MRRSSPAPSHPAASERKATLNSGLRLPVSPLQIPFLILLTFLFRLASPSSGWSQDRRLLKAVEEEIASLMAQNRPCVVTIHTISREISGGGQNESELREVTRRNVGTGVIFDTQGHVLTTTEVVRGADYIEVSLSSGRTVEAGMVAVDDESKVAIVGLRENLTQCPKLGDSDLVKTGHYAFIIGNAYGTMLPSVGTVADYRPAEDLIDISGSASPGHSGAAVFNCDGQVIGLIRGVVTPSAAGGAVPQDQVEAGGWNGGPATLVAIPINRARKVAERLIGGPGWLGLEVEREGTVRVSQVEDGGPADESGLQVGDIIASYNHEDVLNGEHLAHLVVDTPAGRLAQVTIQRGRQMMTILVKVGRRVEQGEHTGLSRSQAGHASSQQRVRISRVLLQGAEDLR